MERLSIGEIIQKAIDLTPESLLITDLRGNIIFANQYAAYLLNLSIQALQVTQIQSFINPDCLDELTDQRIKEELGGILRLLLPSIPQERECSCASALQYAIATDAKYIPKEKKKELGLLIGKYLE